MLCVYLYVIINTSNIIINLTFVPTLFHMSIPLLNLIRLSSAEDGALGVWWIYEHSKNKEDWNYLPWWHFALNLVVPVSKHDIIAINIKDRFTIDNKSEIDILQCAHPVAAAGRMYSDYNRAASSLNGSSDLLGE